MGNCSCHEENEAEREQRGKEVRERRYERVAKGEEVQGLSSSSSSSSSGGGQVVVPVVMSPLSPMSEIGQVVEVETPKWIREGGEEKEATLGSEKKRVKSTLTKHNTIHTHVNNFHLFTDTDFATMQTIMLGAEPHPHHPWKLMYDKDGVKAWKRPPPPTPHLSHATKTTSQLCQVRVEAKLPVSPETAYHVLHDPNYRDKWDHNMVDKKFLEKLSLREEVTYYASKLPRPLSGRDFVTLRGWRELPDGRFIIINRSVEHHNAPSNPSYVRGVSIGSGYLVAPCKNPSECTLYMLSHSDLCMPLPDFIINSIVSSVIASGIPRLREAMVKYAPPKTIPWRSDPTPLYTFEYVSNKIATLCAKESRGRKHIQVESHGSYPVWKPAPKLPSRIFDDTEFTYTETDITVVTHTEVVYSFHTDTAPPTPSDSFR